MHVFKTNVSQVYIGIYGINDICALATSFYDDVFTTRQENGMVTNVMGIWAFLACEMSFGCPTSVVYYYFKRSPLLHPWDKLKKMKRVGTRVLLSVFFIGMVRRKKKLLGKCDPFDFTLFPMVYIYSQQIFSMLFFVI